MRFRKNRMKNIVAAIGSSFFLLLPLQAHSDENTAILKQIQSDTSNMLAWLNDLPKYLNNLTTESLSWLSKQDETTITTDLLNITTALGNDFIANYNAQFDANTATQVTADMLGLPDTAKLTTPKNHPEILDIMPAVNVNDISYWSLIGKPPVENAPNAPYNYVKNASGISIFHTMPLPGWSGSRENIDRYTNYYRTIMSIESFNAYTLNSLAADSGNQTTQQNQLIQKITSSDWSTAVATEDLGIVFRQLLLIESQSFVLLNQMLQTQKQALAAQTMTNSMLILSNINNEQLLLQRASGNAPIAQ